MLKIEISPEAQEDILLLTIYGIENFGASQAEIYRKGMDNQFNLLACYPKLGRVIKNSKYPHCHHFNYGSHRILYTIEERSIVIRRILHGSMDVKKHI